MTGAGRVISSSGVLIRGSSLRGALRQSRNRLSALVLVRFHLLASSRGSSVKLRLLLMALVVVIIAVRRNGDSLHYLPRLSHGPGRERRIIDSTGRCRGVRRGGRRKVNGLRRRICGLDCWTGYVHVDVYISIFFFIKRLIRSNISAGLAAISFCYYTSAVRSAV